MSPKDIQISKTYVNRGAGRTVRTVLAIGDEHRPHHWLDVWGILPPNESGVLYEQRGEQRTSYLSSFAAWAEREVNKPTGC